MYSIPNRILTMRYFLYFVSTTFPFEVRVIPFLIFIVVVGSPGVEAEQEYTFVGQENYAPFSQVDEQGDFTGLDVDIIQKAAKVAGVKVKFERYPWARAVKMVRNGRADGVFGFGMKSERKEFVYYPEVPLRNVKFAFFVNDHFDGAIKGVKGIGRRLVGTVRGYFVSQEFNNDHSIQKYYANNAEQLFLQVSANRHQIAVYSRVAGIYELKRIGITNLRMFPYRNAPIYPSYLAFSKASPRGKDAYKRFSSALKQLEEEGVMNEIYNKYSLY